MKFNLGAEASYINRHGNENETIIHIFICVLLRHVL